MAPWPTRPASPYRWSTPFTLTADSQPDGSFSTYVNQQQVGNYDGGHLVPTGVIGFEAFGQGQARILGMAAYARP